MVDRDRFVVGDEIWAKIGMLLLGKVSDRGVMACDNRLFLEAVLWRVRAGLPWRDLPSDFGNWNSVFHRFRRWALAGLFERIFARLSGEADFDYALIDGTTVFVHQKACGAKGGLKIRPSAARVVARRRKSWPWWTSLATSRGSSCCQASAMTQSVFRRWSRASPLVFY